MNGTRNQVPSGSFEDHHSGEAPSVRPYASLILRHGASSYLLSHIHGLHFDSTAHVGSSPLSLGLNVSTPLRPHVTTAPLGL